MKSFLILMFVAFAYFIQTPAFAIGGNGDGAPERKRPAAAEDGGGKRAKEEKEQKDPDPKSETQLDPNRKVQIFDEAGNSFEASLTQIQNSSKVLFNQLTFTPEAIAQKQVLHEIDPNNFKILGSYMSGNPIYFEIKNLSSPSDQFQNLFQQLEVAHRFQVYQWKRQVTIDLVDLIEEHVDQDLSDVFDQIEFLGLTSAVRYKLIDDNDSKISSVLYPFQIGKRYSCGYAIRHSVSGLFSMVPANLEHRPQHWDVFYDGQKLLVPYLTPEGSVKVDEYNRSQKGKLSPRVSRTYGTLELTNQVYSLVFNATGEKLAIGTVNTAANQANAHQLIVWSFRDNQIVHDFKMNADGLLQLPEAKALQFLGYVQSIIQKAPSLGQIQKILEQAKLNEERRAARKKMKQDQYATESDLLGAPSPKGPVSPCPPTEDFGELLPFLD